MSQGGEVNFLVERAGVVNGGAAFGDVVEGEGGFVAAAGGGCGGSEGDVAALDHEARD